MKKIEIEKVKLEAAFAVACGNTRTVLLALFGEEAVKPEKPDYSDYRNIKTYEDACAALGCTPIDEGTLRSVGVRKGIIALIKLETISRALWGRNYQPKPDAKGESRFYFPWFALWTENEISSASNLVYIPITDALGKRAGFGSAITHYAPSDASASVGSRLWQESPEKAKYFGQQFIGLWFDYLMCNVKRA
mgnify:CR=1 FL=1|jgi:hypothetical protein